ncbi:MAG: histidine phosphatase family protein [Synergistaceae bacterium]|nr:histidine phosphatase family protein [Synergistaceae bacterium]
MSGNEWNRNDHRASQKILLVRHGRTDWNDERRFQGRTDIPLNEEGLLQARKLSERLASWPLDVVYTSPLLRALRTAEAVASPHGKKPVVLEDLSEMYFGPWEGESIAGLRKRSPGLMRSWLKDPFFHMPENAETWEDIQTRVRRAVGVILHSARERVVVVSHGGIMRALFSVLLDLDPRAVWNISASNCSISGVEVREHQNVLKFSNDDLHLRAGNDGAPLPVW